MTCHNCGKALVRTIAPLYHYKESGLSNVYLKNSVQVYRCTCGKKLVEIPGIGRLHDGIAYALLTKKAVLTGHELRFLRKWIGLTAEKLASLLGFKTRVTVSKFENNKSPITMATDHAMRLLVLRQKEEAIKQRMDLEIKFYDWLEGIKPVARQTKITIDAKTIERLPFPPSHRPCISV